MAKWRLSKRADADVLEIAVYTTKRFGPQQARRYHDGLEGTFELLAKHPTRGRSAAELAPDLRRRNYESQ